VHIYIYSNICMYFPDMCAHACFFIHAITHSYSSGLLSNLCLKAIIGARPVIPRAILIVFRIRQIDRQASKCFKDSFIHCFLQSANCPGLLGVHDQCITCVGLPTHEHIGKTESSTGSDVLTEKVPVRRHEHGNRHRLGLPSFTD